jgi:hypothetical protein
MDDQRASFKVLLVYIEVLNKNVSSYIQWW